MVALINVSPAPANYRHNQKTAGKLMPSGGTLKSMFGGLERVPRTDLHHSGIALDLREV